jgi:hypothetical protein
MDNAQSNRKSALHNPKLNGACPELGEGIKFLISILKAITRPIVVQTHALISQNQCFQKLSFFTGSARKIRSGLLKIGPSTTSV